MGIIFHEKLEKSHQETLQQISESIELRPLDLGVAPPSEACIIIVGADFWRPDFEAPVNHASCLPAWTTIPCACWLEHVPTKMADVFWNGWDGLILPTHTEDDYKRIILGLLERKSVEKTLNDQDE